MEKATLDNLLERHAAFLSFVQHRVDDRALAEDILQSAYVRAIERSGNLRAQESAVGWFYQVLRNAVIDHYRARASEGGALQRWAAELELAGEAAAPDDSTLQMACRCIERLLPTLRPAYAEILREVDLNELPLTEYAAGHGLSANNATVRAHRARAALRRELARVCGVCSLHACLDCTCKSGAADEHITSAP